jgi:hypothetical protein
MSVINKKKIEELKEGLSHPEEIESLREELQRVIKVKEESIWQADEAPYLACDVLLLVWRNTEVKLLERALKAVEEGDISAASNILGNYALYLERAEFQGRFHTQL